MILSLVLIYLIMAVAMTIRVVVGYTCFNEERLGIKVDLFTIFAWPVVMVMAAWYVLSKGFRQAVEAYRSM